MWGVSEDQRKVFNFFDFFSRPSIFFQNDKICCVSWKNSEIGPTPAPLRISRFELDEGQGGRRAGQNQPKSTREVPAGHFKSNSSPLRPLAAEKYVCIVGGVEFLKRLFVESDRSKKSIFRPKSKVVARCEIWVRGVKKHARGVPGNDFWPPTKHNHL